jgi:hypothetical protein
MLEGEKGGRWRTSEHARRSDTRGFPDAGRQLTMEFSAHKRLMHNIRSGRQLTTKRQIEARLIAFAAAITRSDASRTCLQAKLVNREG